MIKRTHNCGQLRLDDVGENVAVAGWVRSYRDHGNLIFVDLRDRYGIVQLVFDPEISAAGHELAEKVRCEWVIAASGVVRPRGEGLENPKLATGQIEIAVSEAEILNVSKTPPFEIDAAQKVNEEIRLSNRYIDLRRPIMQARLGLRHKATKVVRDFFDENHRGRRAPA